MSTVTKQREDFEHWVVNMDEFLEDFYASIPEDLAAELDYSKTSLVALESYILSSYNSIDEIQKPDQSAKLNGLSIYLGETFRKGLGGYWDIELEDEENSEYGVPALADFGEDKDFIAPIFLVTASIERRTGNYLIDIYEANMPEQ